MGVGVGGRIRRGSAGVGLKGERVAGLSGAAHARALWGPVSSAATARVANTGGWSPAVRPSRQQGARGAPPPTPRRLLGSQSVQGEVGS